MKEILSNEYKMFIDNNGCIKMLKSSLFIIRKVLTLIVIYILLIYLSIEILENGLLNNQIVTANKICVWFYSTTILLSSFFKISILTYMIYLVSLFILDRLLSIKNSKNKYY